MILDEVNPKPTTGLFAVCDPQGNLVHTTVCTTPEEAIAEWLSIERGMNWLVNLMPHRRGNQRCLPSWEGFEAEGYRIVPVTLSPDEVTHAEHA